MILSDKQIYIKGISVSKEKFKDLNNRIFDRYSKTIKNVCFSDFKKGILFAFVLGKLSAYGDHESVRLFFHCLGSNYVPIIKIFEYENEIKIYLCMNI